MTFISHTISHKINMDAIINAETDQNTHKAGYQKAPSTDYFTSSAKGLEKLAKKVLVLIKHVIVDPFNQLALTLITNPVIVVVNYL